MLDVVTLGEAMAVMTPNEQRPMRYVSDYKRTFGGAELNVMIGLSRLGHKTGWISRVGEDEFGKGLLAFSRGEKVNVSQVKLDMEAPTGLYFKELRSPGDVRVYYYRKNSAASFLSVEDIDRDYIKNAKFLFVTGITPALSSTCREAVFEAIRLAKDSGVQIVFDPNLRKKLWSEDEARQVLLKMIRVSDIVLPGFAECEFLFGKGTKEIFSQRIRDQGPSLVVMKLGEKGAFYCSPQESEVIPGFPVKHVIDPVGAGDGFTTGLISGLLDHLPVNEAVRRANAVGAMVTQIKGDLEGLPERTDLFRFLNSGQEDVDR